MAPPYDYDEALDDGLGEKMLQQNLPEGKKIRTGLWPHFQPLAGTKFAGIHV
jgi:hypothetical protein